jgi:hypothetical protein
MHVDDNLYVATGEQQMHWAMWCSIAGLQMIFGPNEPDLHPCQPDLEKFLAHPVSFECHQLGYITNTRTMTVTIPDDKCQEMLTTLREKWASTSQWFSFHLCDASKVLGLFIYLCHVCPWVIFLCQNLYHAMNHALHRNATRILNNPTMQMAITHCDQYHHHPTNSSKYRFFSHKVARTIYNSKESTYLTPDIHAKADFLVTGGNHL